MTRELIQILRGIEDLNVVGADLVEVSKRASAMPSHSTRLLSETNASFSVRCLQASTAPESRQVLPQRRLCLKSSRVWSSVALRMDLALLVMKSGLITARMSYKSDSKGYSASDCLLRRPSTAGVLEAFRRTRRCQLWLLSCNERSRRMRDTRTRPVAHEPKCGSSTLASLRSRPQS